MSGLFDESDFPAWAADPQPAPADPGAVTVTGARPDADLAALEADVNEKGGAVVAAETPVKVPIYDTVKVESPVIRPGFHDPLDARAANRAVPVDYAAIPGMNWSTLKHIARSPKEFQWRLTHPEKPKAAYDFGRAFHCAILEPKVFPERYVAEPDFGDGRTKAAKLKRAAWEAENKGREPISYGDMTAILAMAAAVREHKVAGKLLEGVKAEQTITWTDAETGVRCKARLDMLGKDFLADVKTSRDPAFRPFARDAADHLYHGQLAMYFDGAIANGLLSKHADAPYIIVPEKSEPWDVAVYRMHRNLVLDVGRLFYRSLLRRWLDCTAANWWPGIAPELQILELPSWAPGMDEPAPSTDDGF